MTRVSALKSIGLSTIIFGALVLLTASTGCGSIGDSLFGDGDDNSGGDPNANNSSGGFTNGTSGGSNNGTSGAVGNVGQVTPTSACASAHGGAVLSPISLVFMIDRSGSMQGENGGTQNLAVRWNPVKSGLSTFFADPASSNVSASLSFFPIGGGQSPDCNFQHYMAPTVALTQLPNGAAFSNAFAQGPDGMTPTFAALKGAIETAKTIKAGGKNAAVVLATDGEPRGCEKEGNTITNIEKVAADGLAEGIKTYVIGVGPSTGNLNSFASNGGTKQAIMIPTNNTAQVSADLIAAIGNIATTLLGCNFGLPAAPAGQTLDVNAVNVNYTAPNGTATTLAYSQDCSNPQGWHYDNTAAPKEIILCTNSCNTAQAELGAKLDIIFGCATQVPPGGTDPNGNVH